jgi:RNase adapter protein RapZ
MSFRLRRSSSKPPRSSSKAPSHRIEDFVVITGFSGAGKSQAMATFEDAGYFCVDNLPPEMIGSLAELFSHKGSKVERAAVASDVRGGDFFDGLVKVLDDLDKNEVPYRLLYLEADEHALINRFKETRRRHPLAGGGAVESALRQERQLLAASSPSRS